MSLIFPGHLKSSFSSRIFSSDAPCQKLRSDQDKRERIKKFRHRHNTISIQIATFRVLILEIFGFIDRIQSQFLCRNLKPIKLLIKTPLTVQIDRDRSYIHGTANSSERIQMLMNRYQIQSVALMQNCTLQNCR